MISTQVVQDCQVLTTVYDKTVRSAVAYDKPIIRPIGAGAGP